MADTLPDLTGIRGQRLVVEFTWDGTDPPMPDGAPVMEWRSRPTAAGTLVLDCTAEGYLTRAGNVVTLDVPASRTLTLPPTAYYDLWINPPGHAAAVRLGRPGQVTLEDGPTAG